VKKLLVSVLIASLPMVSAGTAHAKKKKAPAATVQTQKSKDGAVKPPPPNDKRTNEGAQGRMNATEDAARSADSPQFDRRP
jgi:hypothetical protein